ncbi:MarR family winged helix-turn-helix transcriptional regulator [uncultured Cohaesibacter sp.]|uniref:MarR family winged helix-turn-helix transcriptional regulator n=1 Tax=uncultured Cohaesibacter sp. TaxID=1002546 RepID=UPI00293099FB|nr:MarR family winged helix-turn-helix transcriptional regulator [uncultured Cohaesibacter sp.]
MAKSGDAIQVSMFDALPDLAPPQKRAKDERKPEALASDELETEEEDFEEDGSLSPTSAFADEQAFTLDNFLPYRILEISQGISRRIGKVLQERWDISLAEWQVLASLAKDGQVSVREVEPRTLLDTVAVSRAAKRLTDRKFIKREVNKQDKRLVVLKTTKKGRDVAAEIGRCVMDMESDFLKGMHVQDRIRLSQLLKSLR